MGVLSENTYHTRRGWGFVDGFQPSYWKVVGSFKESGRNAMAVSNSGAIIEAYDSRAIAAVAGIESVFNLRNLLHEYALSF